MTLVEQLAAFVARTTYEELSEEARQALKIRVLDSLGCAIGALTGPPIGMLRTQLEDFGGKPLVTLIGGGKNAPDRAAFYNAALVRYLDYNDTRACECSLSCACESEHSQALYLWDKSRLICQAL